MICAPLPFSYVSSTFITFGLDNFGEPVDGGSLMPLFPITAFRPGRFDKGTARRGVADVALLYALWCVAGPFLSFPLS